MPYTIDEKENDGEYEGERNLDDNDDDDNYDDGGNDEDAVDDDFDVDDEERSSFFSSPMDNPIPSIETNPNTTDNHKSHGIELQNAYNVGSLPDTALVEV